MKIHRLILMALLAMAYASNFPTWLTLAQDVSDDLPVVQAVPPAYPLIARAANVSGVVVLEVKVGASGSVQAVRIIEGHKLLSPVSEKAARKWKFNALDKAKDRRVQLRFEFVLIATNKGTPEDLGVIFWPPHKVEIRDARNRVD